MNPNVQKTVRKLTSHLTEIQRPGVGTGRARR